MFTTNPFTPLTDFMSPGVMQGYIVLMVLAVVIGTVFDLLRDSKLTFFLQERQRAKAAAKQPLSAADRTAIAARTLVHDIATFGEFCNQHRRISHALMFYGFVLYLVTTVAMVFVYPTDTRPPVVLPILWNIGILMALVGGYWFFFFLRVNVVHDGHPPWRLVRADLFIVTLLASLTFALLFEWVAMMGNLMATQAVAGLYIFFTTLLFVSVRPYVLQTSHLDFQWPLGVELRPLIPNRRIRDYLQSASTIFHDMLRYLEPRDVPE